MRERDRQGERERGVIAHHSSPTVLGGSSSSCSSRETGSHYRWNSKLSLESEFRRQKKGNRAEQRGRSRARVTGLSVRADVTIGRLFLATSPAPAMLLGLRKAEVSHHVHAREKARGPDALYCFEGGVDIRMRDERDQVYFLITVYSSPAMACLSRYVRCLTLAISHVA